MTIRSPHQKLTEKLNSGFDDNAAATDADDDDLDDDDLDDDLDDDRAGTISEARASSDDVNNDPDDGGTTGIEVTVDEEECRELSIFIFFSSLHHLL